MVFKEIRRPMFPRSSFCADGVPSTWEEDRQTTPALEIYLKVCARFRYYERSCCTTTRHEKDARYLELLSAWGVLPFLEQAVFLLFVY